MRIRFYFNTLDNSWNTGRGWEITDFSVSSNATTLACAETSSNDSMATATVIGVGNTVSNATICPAGDLDYYKFTGLAGERISASVSAISLGSSMDPVLTLYDTNGSLMTENDDKVLYQDQDSLLGAVLPYTGTYYLKVKAWDYPGSGGQSYFYTLRLLDDQSHPNVTLISPNQGWISNNPFAIEAAANDDGGIAKVEFFWHSSDWTNGIWQSLGSDADGSDGWRMVVDPNNMPNLTGGGVYVKAYDFSGNTWGAMLLNLAIEGGKPTSQLSTLAGTTQSTAVQLHWSASDSQSGVDHLDFQYQVDGGAWQTWDLQPGSATSAWFIKAPGHTYGFRMRAVDRAGNMEDFPGSAEASTTLSASCSGGSYEPGNDSPGGAVTLTVDQPASGVFCQPADRDWYAVQLQGGQTYAIAVTSTGGGAAAKIQVNDSQGVLTQKDAAGLGQSMSLILKAPSTGTYTIQVSPLTDDLYGSGVTYNVVIFEPDFIYLPMVKR